MAGIYDSYKIALLDSTFFVSDFPDEVRDGLCGIKIYVADTFNSEIEQYRKVLSPERSSYYDSNVHFLNGNVRLNTLKLDTSKPEYAHLNNDVWGLVSLLVGLNANFVLISANQLLIQRIILHELKVDIFDLNTNQFIRYKSFPTLKSDLKFPETSGIKYTVETKSGEGTTLYLKNGKRVVLGKEMKAGLEATLYYLKDTSRTIAKVFKKDRLPVEKYQSISNIVGHNTLSDISWAKFPRDVIYYDAACNNPAGIIEDYVSTKSNIDRNPLYLGDPFNVADEYLKKHLSYSVNLCIKIVRQVCYLNTCGFYVSDFNLGNFAELPDNNDNIQMWDTDSFGYDAFFGRYFSPDYVESINHPKYDMSSKDGAIDISNDALYQFIFTIFSLGDSPISCNTRKFKYDNPKYFGVSRIKCFPQNIWNHMADVFRGNRLPSAEALLKELMFTSDQLRTNPVQNKTFEQIFADVVPGFAEAREEIVDPPEPVDPPKPVDPPEPIDPPDKGGLNWARAKEGLKKWAGIIFSIIVIFILLIIYCEMSANALYDARTQDSIIAESIINETENNELSVESSSFDNDISADAAIAGIANNDWSYNE